MNYSHAYQPTSVYVRADESKICAKPPIKASSIVFLGPEREMPITRQSTTNKTIRSDAGGGTKIILNGTVADGHKLYVSSREPKSRYEILVLSLKNIN